MSIHITRGWPKWLPSLRYGRHESVEDWGIDRGPVVLVTKSITFTWLFNVTIEWYE